MTVACFRCKRRPEEIGEYRSAVLGTNLSPEDYVKAEEGTYNPETGRFACTECYIAVGQPVRADGRRWVAP